VRAQLMRHEHDDSPVLIDTGLTATNLKWATNGSVLALAGSYSGGQAGGAAREVAMVQFYSPYGQHLRTLKVPGGGIQALSWEGGSLRVALAVDTFIYFANIRPDYRWGFFGDTLVAAYAQPERTDSTVLFWNTKTDERVLKYHNKLLNVRAASENCVLAMQTDSNPQYMLLLCNAIGSPLDSKYIDVEPTYLTVTPYHVVAASHSFLYVWQYRTLMSKLTSVDLGTGSLRRKEGRERCFHIDDPPANHTADAIADVAGREPSADPIIAVGASQHCLLVARESGAMLRYSLPHIALEHTYTLRCRPQTIAINCESTKCAVIDTNGILTLLDIGSPGSCAPPPPSPPPPPPRARRLAHTCPSHTPPLVRCLAHAASRPLPPLTGQPLGTCAAGTTSAQGRSKCRRQPRATHRRASSARTCGTCAGPTTTPSSSR
jgi:WD repeat-containing protein 35